MRSRLEGSFSLGAIVLIFSKRQFLTDINFRFISNPPKREYLQIVCPFSPDESMQADKMVKNSCFLPLHYTISHNKNPDV